MSDAKIEQLLERVKELQRLLPPDPAVAAAADADADASTESPLKAPPAAHPHQAAQAQGEEEAAQLEAATLELLAQVCRSASPTYERCQLNRGSAGDVRARGDGPAVLGALPAHARQAARGQEQESP